MQISFSAYVSLPSPGPSLTLKGLLSSGTLIFAGPRRFILSADASEALRVSSQEAQNKAERIYWGRLNIFSQ